MEFLPAIQAQTEQFIKELKWTDTEIENLISMSNRVMNHNLVNSTCETNSKKIVTSNSADTSNSLVVHQANYDGGFILFGGWTNIYDHMISSGTRGHKLYLAFGGLGVGGWSGGCDIELITEETIYHDNEYYEVPKYHYDNNDWDGYNTGFRYFHDHVVSFMFMYLPQFVQPFPIFVYFDKDSNRLGVSIPNSSISCGMGGGTVSVE